MFFISIIFIQNNKVRYKYGVKVVKIELSMVKEGKALKIEVRDLSMNIFFHSWTVSQCGVMPWSLCCTVSPSWSVPCSLLFLLLIWALVLMA